MSDNKARKVSLAVQAEEWEQRLLSMMHGLACGCSGRKTGQLLEFGFKKLGPYPVPAVPLNLVEEQSLVAGVRAALALLHDADRVFNLQPTAKRMRQIRMSTGLCIHMQAD